MRMTTEAGQWLAENGGFRFRHLAHWKDHKHGETDLAIHLRRKAKVQTVREFVVANRHAKSADCIFVPDAKKGAPATIRHCDRTITAAKYMALLTFGTPRNEGAVVRHLCGNGHLSCVNPAHLEWGSETNNRRDAGKHRWLETVQDKIHATAGRR